MKKYSLFLILLTLLTLCLVGCPTEIETTTTSTTILYVTPKDPSIIDTFHNGSVYVGGTEIGVIEQSIELFEDDIVSIIIYDNSNFDVTSCTGTITAYSFNGDSTEDMTGYAEYVFTADDSIMTMYTMPLGGTDYQPLYVEYNKYHKKTATQRLISYSVTYYASTKEVTVFETREFNADDEELNHVVYDCENGNFTFNEGTNTVSGSSDFPKDYEEINQYEAGYLAYKTIHETHHDVSGDHVHTQRNVYYWNNYLPIREPAIIENYSVDESGDMYINTRTFAERKGTSVAGTSCIVFVTQNSNGDNIIEESCYYELDPFVTESSVLYLTYDILSNYQGSSKVETVREKNAHYLIDGKKVYYHSRYYNDDILK